MIKKTLLASTLAAGLIVPAFAERSLVQAKAGLILPPKPAIIKSENLEFSKHMLAMPLTMGMLPGKAVALPWDYIGVSGFGSSSSGNVTLSEPSGVQQGDLLVAVISYRSNAAFTSPGSPWAQVTVQNSGNTTAGTTGSIASGVMFWCLRGSSAPGLTFTRTGGDVAVGHVLAYRNAASSGTLVTSTSTTMASAATSVSVSGLTTANANDLVVVGFCGARLGGTTAFNATNPGTSSGTNSNQTADPIVGTWQERLDSQDSSGADCSLSVADAVRDTAGATGNFTITASANARHVVLAAAFKRNS